MALARAFVVLAGLAAVAASGTRCEGEDARVVRPVDWGVLVRHSVLREEVHDALLDARGIELLPLIELLLVVRDEIEQAILLQRPSDRRAELLLIEGKRLAVLRRRR